MRFHERPAFVPTVTVVALSLSALGASAVPPPGASAPIVDRPGPRVRIVSLSLPADEVLLALTGPERIVALDEFADDPASNVRDEARQVDRRVHASVEEVLACDPDLVLASAWATAEVRDAIARAGVSLTVLPAPTTLDEVEANVRTVAAEIGASDGAERLLAEMRTRIAAVEARVRGLSRPSVLLRSEGGISPGAGTLAEVIVERAGGRLVTAALGLAGFVPLPAERALSLDVDVVIVDAYRADGRARTIGDDPALSVLSRRARVVEVAPNLLMTTSHHVASTIEHLAAVLHPEPGPP